MPYSPQDVYARHLSSLRGYPLWMPEPSHQLLVYRRDGLKIGDVGMVIPEDGCFDVFFNICLPQDHPFHRATGVPDNFEPIELSDMDIRTAVSAENPGRIIATSSVKRVRTVERFGGSSSSTPSGLEYEFNLSSSEGALLILPEGAERHDLRNYHRFFEAATRHGADWYRFAEERVGQIIGHDSLYLITGLYKTSSWSLAAFEKTAGTAEYPAQFKVSQLAGDNVASAYTWDTTRALDWRVGPVDSLGIPNQTVFIRGFKIALRTGMFGTRWISVKADVPSTRPNPAKSIGAVPGDSWLGYIFGGPSVGRTTEPSGHGTQDEVVADSALDAARSEIQNNGAIAVGEHVVIHRVPEVPQPFHPSDIINRYLLNKDPSANISITHDDDWITLLEENLLQPEDLAQEGRLEALVSQKYDVISEQGLVYMQSRRNSDQDTSDADKLDATVDGREPNAGKPAKAVIHAVPSASSLNDAVRDPSHRDTEPTFVAILSGDRTISATTPAFKPQVHALEPAIQPSSQFTDSAISSSPLRTRSYSSPRLPHVSFQPKTPEFNRPLPSRSPTLPHPRRRLSRRRVSLIAGRASIAPIEPPSRSPAVPQILRRPGSVGKALSSVVSTGPPTPTSDSQMPPDRKTISGFFIEREIARGSYGLVKRAREYKSDGALGSPLVIKQIIKSRILADCWKRHHEYGTIPVEIYVMSLISATSYTLPPPRAWDPRRHRRSISPPRTLKSDSYWEEGKVVKGHPNICSLLDFFEDTHYYYLVLPSTSPEHLPSEPRPPTDLFDLVEAYPEGLSPTAIRSYLGQLADALCFLHDHGIVHRDVKDENVVLGQDGLCVLIDFGSSGLIKNTGWDTFSGTLDYAAPEILRGERYYGKEQDVWAFGVVAYILLVGECPFLTAAEAQEGLESPFANASIALEERCGDDKANDGEEVDGGGALGDAAALVRACLQVDVDARATFEGVLRCRFLSGHDGWGMKKPYGSQPQVTLQTPAFPHMSADERDEANVWPQSPARHSTMLASDERQSVSGNQPQIVPQPPVFPHAPADERDEANVRPQGLAKHSIMSTSDER